MIGGPRPAAGGPAYGAPAQRALGDDSPGPLQFDPTLAEADEKAAESKKEAAAAPATECIAPPQAVAAKETLVAKDRVAVNDSPKVEPARVNPALASIKPKRPAAPVVATVCYVQRDGTCAPSF